MSENRGRPGRPRLQRSERVFSESHLTSWELFVRDSLLTLAWPELLNSVSRMLLGLPRFCSASASSMMADAHVDGFSASQARVRGSSITILNMISGR